MRNRLLHPPIFLIITLMLILSIGSVYAVDPENQVDLNNFPTRLAEAFNISEYAARMLASMIVMVMFILPTAIFSKTLLPPLFVGLLVMGFCIAVGWLDVFFILAPILIIGLLYGGKMRDWFGGRGS